MIDKRDNAVIKEEIVQEVIEELLQQDTFIEHVNQVMEEVKKKHQLEITGDFVRM